MLGLKKKEKVVENEAVSERPKPRLVVCNYPLDEYSEVADKIGFHPGELLQRQVLQFLADEKMPVYDYDKVMAYLKVDLDKVNERRSSYEYFNIAWAPLRDRDRFSGNPDNFSGSLYSRLIPVTVLKDVRRVEKKFEYIDGDNRLRFFASDYTTLNPDPFVMVTSWGMDRIVFGVWDEPGFGLEGR